MELNIDKTGWKKVKFGEVCRQVNETARNPQEEGLIHVVGLEHIGSNDLHIRSWNTLERETTFTRKFVKGQVLFGRRRAYQAKVAYAEFDGICSGDILVFEAIKSKLLPELLPFMVQSQKFYNKAVETSAGSLSPRTKFKDLADLEFLLPTKDQQARLAELLWAADEVVEKEMEVKERLEKLENNCIQKICDQNVLNPNYKLGDVVVLNYGKALKETDREQGKFDVVSSSGITGSHSSSFVKGPGVVVGRKGSAGNVIWVENDFWVIDTAYWVTLKTDIVLLEFVYLLLISLNLQKLSISTAIPGLNRDDAYDTKVFLPAIFDQIAIIKQYKEIKNLIIRAENQISLSQQLKQGLINEIF